MQHFAALFLIMLRRNAPPAALLLLGVGLAGFDGCHLTPTMQGVPSEIEASSTGELDEALELAQELGSLVTYSGQGEFQVCFDNEELAKQYTRRVNSITGV